MQGTATIPGEALGMAAEEVEVQFDYTPGCDAQVSGPPESCYPAEAPEIDGITAYVDGSKVALSNEEDAKAVEWLFSNYEFGADDDGPDPDDWYDSRRNEED